MIVTAIFFRRLPFIILKDKRQYLLLKLKNENTGKKEPLKKAQNNKIANVAKVYKDCPTPFNSQMSKGSFCLFSFLLCY